MILRSFLKADLGLFRVWFTDDTDGEKYLSSYSEPEKLIPLIDNQSRFLFIVEHNAKSVGFFDFETRDTTGHFSFYLAKEYRGKGLGKELLNQALQLDAVKKVTMLEVGVEEENHSSRHVLESLGFVEFGRDKDNMLVYRK